jgi:5-methylcytosine-specific restriction endonuclease McrA
MAKRKRLSTTQRIILFQKHGGICHICGGKIGIGESWELEHIIPFAMGGEDNESNWAPAHIKCHRDKTTIDVGQIAKAKRREARHLGGHTSRSPLPFGKKSPLKRKMDGTVVRRYDDGTNSTG